MHMRLHHQNGRQTRYLCRTGQSAECGQVKFQVCPAGSRHNLVQYFPGGATVGGILHKGQLSKGTVIEAVELQRITFALAQVYRRSDQVVAASVVV